MFFVVPYTTHPDPWPGQHNIQVTRSFHRNIGNVHSIAYSLLWDGTPKHEKGFFCFNFQLPTFLLLIVLFGIAALAATTAIADPSASYKQTVEWQYKKASDYYYTLRNNPSLNVKREKWLNGVHELQRIYQIDPKNKRAASCLYTIARMYRTMYERFGNTADLDKAVSFYKDIITFFPKGKKADNSLYALAQIEQEERGDFKQAVQYYDQLMHLYPNSNKKRLVKQQLRKLIATLEKNISQPSVPVRQTASPSRKQSRKQSQQQVAVSSPVQRSARPVVQKNETIILERKVNSQESSETDSQENYQTSSQVNSQANFQTSPQTKIVLSALKKVDSKLLPEQGIRVVEKIQQVQPVQPQPVTQNIYLQQTPGTVEVLPVQYWSSDNYTRVVIKSSEPVDYHVKLSEQENGIPHIPQPLLIDFTQSYIPVKYRSPVAIEDGLLKHIQTSQLDATTVRVALETKSIGDYKVFTLQDPFRVVVDIRGDKNKSLKIPPKKTAPKIITDIKTYPSPAKTSDAVKYTLPHKTKVKVQGSQEGPMKFADIITYNLSDKSDKQSSIVISPPPVLIEVATKKKKEAVKAVNKPALKILTPRNKKRVPRTAKNANLSLAQQLGLGIRRIVIDPGHGGKDPGAVGFGLKEKNIVLNVAKKIKKILEAKKSYEVFLTRENDVSISLEERTAIANTKEADLFLSIHVNAHPEKNIRGVETFFLNLATHTEAMRVAALENATSTHNMSEMQDILAELMQNEKINESSQLAQFVQLNMVQGLKKEKFHVKDLGVKQAPFYVLIGAEMPAILAEISFITNPKEAKLMKSEKYLQAIAKQIVAGVLSYVEHQRTAALKMAPSPTTSGQKN
ncbi:MAG: AMIN domain-containing protein [Candidatus Electrothrix sp. AX2]|nr:AMIN domain-containing protein [Candidatus Electrothrix gigas]